MNINNNSITLMNHTITINDMIDNLYYRTELELSKNEKALKIIYINNLDENDRNNFYYIINAKISEESKKANLINPIFKFIDINDDINDEYFLDIDNYSNKNNVYLEYKTTNKCNYKLNIYQTENDKYKFNHRDWSWHISYLEPFYSTLKFKIKEERITRKLRNDFNEYKIINNDTYNKIMNDIADLKYYIGILYFIIFLNFFI